MSHSEFYSMSSIVTWIFRHLRPLPLNWDLPETATPAEQVVSPSAEKTMLVAGFEPTSYVTLSYVAALSICLLMNSPGFMMVSLDFFQFHLRTILELASWTLMIDERACPWVKETFICPSTKLPRQGLPPLAPAPPDRRLRAWCGYLHSEPRAARRFQCLHPERKWAFNTLKWTNFSKESSNKRSSPTSDMHIYFHFLDHFPLIARTCIDD